MCLNKKVVAGLVIAALAVLLVAPQAVGAAFPLLLLAACPLSMLVMMTMMSKGEHRSTEPGSRSDPTAELEELRADVARLQAQQSSDTARRPLRPSH